MFFENPTLNAISQGAALGGALGASVGAQPAASRRRYSLPHRTTQNVVSYEPTSCRFNASQARHLHISWIKQHDVFLERSIGIQSTKCCRVIVRYIRCLCFQGVCAASVLCCHECTIIGELIWLCAVAVARNA